MPGFVRRYSYFPATSELTAIEGVVIVDLPSPGGYTGADRNAAAVVGEYADMSYACTVNTSGAVVVNNRAVEIFSGGDLLDKMGGFDSTLGKTGTEQGNGFIELRNKRFKRLVCCPIDLVTQGSGTQYALRCWRDLPTNTSATSVVPIVPVQGTIVPAGTEFRTGTDRVRLAQKVQFTAKSVLSSGVDGTTTVAGLPAATVTITRATGSFVTDGVAEGDVVVAGSLAAAAASQNLVCAGGGLLRIVSVNSNGLEITVQRMDGGNFTAGTHWAAGSALAFRVHDASDADSGGEHQLSEAAGYTVLCRPLDATVAAATTLSPTTTPLSATATQWDVLSGLTLKGHPSGALTYDANVHAPNAALNSTIRARYVSAIGCLLNDAYPTNVIGVVTCCRKDATIQAALRAHVLSASAVGLTRVCCVSPPLSVQTMSAVLATAAPGVGGTSGAVRNERVVYDWPGAQTYIPECVNTSITGADGLTYTDGMIDTTFDTWVASLFTQLQPELNPGQATDPVPQTFAYILGYARGTPVLNLSDYILLKQYGVCALRMDRTAGPIIQSGVTTSLTSGETNINRRRMADYVQDTLAERYLPYSKQLGSEAKKDALLSEAEAFCADLLSENNPQAQRIAAYSNDDRSANTQALAATGVHVIITKVQMLGTLDTIVAQTEIGPAVDTTVTVQ